MLIEQSKQTDYSNVHLSVGTLLYDYYWICNELHVLNASYEKTRTKPRMGVAKS